MKCWDIRTLENEKYFIMRDHFNTQTFEFIKIPWPFSRLFSEQCLKDASVCCVTKELVERIELRLRRFHDFATDPLSLVVVCERKVCLPCLEKLRLRRCWKRKLASVCGDGKESIICDAGRSPPPSIIAQDHERTTVARLTASTWMTKVVSLMEISATFVVVALHLSRVGCVVEHFPWKFIFEWKVLQATENKIKRRKVVAVWGYARTPINIYRGDSVTKVRLFRPFPPHVYASTQPSDSLPLRSFCSALCAYRRKKLFHCEKISAPDKSNKAQHWRTLFASRFAFSSLFSLVNIGHKEPVARPESHKYFNSFRHKNSFTTTNWGLQRQTSHPIVSKTCLTSIW